MLFELAFSVILQTSHPQPSPQEEAEYNTVITGRIDTICNAFKEVIRP